MTDDAGPYAYGPEVVFELRADRQRGLPTAAAFVDADDVDVLCVQHEFGIFGGDAVGTSTSCSSTSARPS